MIYDIYVKPDPCFYLKGGWKEISLPLDNTLCLRNCMKMGQTLNESSKWRSGLLRVYIVTFWYEKLLLAIIENIIQKIFVSKLKYLCIGKCFWIKIAKFLLYVLFPFSESICCWIFSKIKIITQLWLVKKKKLVLNLMKKSLNTSM